MEFLYEKIYSNQYFALILFVTIAILLILFVVVLFAAIRDTKRKELEGLDRLEQETKDRVLSDDTIFGVEKAFSEEAPKEPLEFFKNEDDISKTRDMVLKTPTKDNSMNSLLNEFDDEKKEPIVSEPTYNELPIEPISSYNPPVQNINSAPVHEDIVVPDVVVPIPEVSGGVPEPSVESISNVSSSSVVAPMPKIDDIPKVVNTPYVEENVINRVPKVEETKIDDNDDEFELPAIKNNNINLEKEVSPSSINSSGIDFGKTGIINFANIESESYEIK